MNEPWERPACVRRDCEPHRGQFLDTMATVSILCGVLSVCLVFPCVIGLPLGIAVWRACRRDVSKMEAGLMDPEGWRPTEGFAQKVPDKTEVGGVK